MNSEIQGNAVGYVRQTAASTATMGLTYVMLGFALTAALAWMTLVRFVIKTYVNVPGTAGMYLFLYAVVVTVLAAIVYNIFSRYASIPVVPIVGVVA